MGIHLDRTQCLIAILEAAAHKQHHISIILEAKSLEAAKARNWLCGRVGSHEFADHTDLLKHSAGVHEQLIEVIDAMTKLENSLAKNLKIVLGHEDELGGGGGLLGGMGGLGGFSGGLFGGSASS